MKAIMGILSVVLLSATVNAKTITIEAPDEMVTQDAIYSNFDGSITIINPKVSVNNQYLLIHLASRDGACLLYNKSTAVRSDYLRTNETTAMLMVTGTSRNPVVQLADLTKAKNVPSINILMCR